MTRYDYFLFPGNHLFQYGTTTFILDIGFYIVVVSLLLGIRIVSRALNSVKRIRDNSATHQEDTTTKLRNFSTVSYITWRDSRQKTSISEAFHDFKSIVKMQFFSPN